MLFEWSDRSQKVLPEDAGRMTISLTLRCNSPKFIAGTTKSKFMVQNGNHPNSCRFSTTVFHERHCLPAVSLPRSRR
ncbi:hypothetical protein BJX63DRAFT_102777 [Aspergillus granulosus]|uniref:Uncharacterized protein n=1 Tax=Aspergillus granulosus TaxID=176169 RepID=A0ABR4HQ48_9EURO